MNWEDRGSEIVLFTPETFRYNVNLDYLARSAKEVMYQIDQGCIFTLIPLAGQASEVPPLVEISGEEEGVLRVRFLGDDASEQKAEMRAAVARYVREWFDLDADLSAFYELARQDALLSKVIDRFSGLRIMGIPNLFEALCWGIIGQQINLTFAYTLKRRLVEMFGRSVEWNGRTFWTFPKPEDIAELALGDLTALQLTGKKSEYLLGVARLMAEGGLTKAQLVEAGDLKAAEKRLVSIRGIGPWTANYVLMRCLRMPAAFPIEDVGLHNAIKHLLGLEKKPTLEDIRRLSLGWTNLEAYATFYLWRSLY
ncbi:DNA-3-methyladenine glycosylase family protein [Paenibacillus cremeus]|uniref:DNA-3-methyladenine glycosylase II n=1 Tax=Paenibacillus cremeus TaxID=2163881 RepID=A0A559KEI9_9BACL|nr:DNA-3-methyladenine glycosylase [Paenibacillus cremeus]TVY10539.1 DNA-3-methyladenine glycosylase 2 family protein [Paenibacillus cremeus]